MNKLRSKSQENLVKLGECMENLDDDVSKLFIECPQTDFRQDPELLRLLNDYFTRSKGVSELCDSLRNCLERTEQKELSLIDGLINDFHEEKKSYEELLLEGSFRKTISDLTNFCEFDDSGDCDDYDLLAGDFLSKTHECHEKLAEMIVKLEATMKEIDGKLKRARGRRAVVAAAVIAPVIAVACVSKFVAGVFSSVPVEPVASFAASKWRKATETLKQERTAVTTMEREAMVALKEIERIGVLVARLETVERSIRATARLAVKKRSSVAAAVGGMERDRKRLKSTLVDLDKETVRCNGFAQLGRTLARDQIFQFLSHGDKIATK